MNMIRDIPEKDEHARGTVSPSSNPYEPRSPFLQR